MTRSSNRLLWSAFLALLALSGCKDFSFYGVLGDRIDDTPLQISPASISLTELATVTFSATGGKPPYAFSVVSGSGTIGAATGLYTASGTAGSEVVRVTDSKGRRSDAAVTVTSSGATLQIAPPSVSVLVGGDVQFYASGGTPPYTFSVLTNNSGAPPMAGDVYTAGLSGGVTDTVQVLDGAALTATASVDVLSMPVADVDYRVLAVNFPAAGTGGSAIPAGFDFTVQNNGTTAGTQPVSWWVYISDDGTLGSGDSLLSSGSTGALASLATADVPLAGTWPLADGAKRLFVLLAAGDDLDNSNNTSGGSAVTLSLPDIDYGGAVAHGTGTTTGAAFTGTLTITNGGGADGAQTVSWSVYASLGNTTIDAGDKLVGTGTIAGGLASGAGSGALPIGNTWPAAAGTYYLVADIQAADDVNTADNRPASGGVAVADAPAPAVDYSGTVSAGAPTRAGGTFTASLTVTNGPAAAGSSTVYWSVYASLGNTTIEVGDKLVGSGSFAGLPASGSSGALPISSSWPAATGAYYLVASIQADDETAPANNTPASAAVNVGVTDYSGVVAHTGGATAGAAFTGTLTISNISGAYALNGSQDLYWNVYASLGDTTIDTDDKVVGSGVISGGLAAGGSSGALAIANTWPTTAGTYYLLADLFAGDDANTANNRPFSTGVAVAAPPAVDTDYSGAVAHTGGTTAGAAFTGTITITNSGSAAGTQDVDWFVYASRSNATIEAGDTLVASGTILGGLGAGADSGALPIANTWPATTGNYYLVADIQALDDTNTTNNQPASGAVTVTAAVTPTPDYTGTVSAGAPTRAGAAFTASLTVDNTASAAGSSTVYWSVYASLGNTTIEVGDKLVGSGSFAGLLPMGSSGALPITSTWPVTTGSYYLVASILADDDSDLTDNTPASAAVNVGATDYSGVVVHSAGTTAGAAFTGTLTIGNISGALALNGSQDLYWNVYASLGDTTIDTDDKVVGSGVIAGGLAAGGSSGALAIANTWPTTVGTYYLLADIYAGDDANTANNRPFSTGVAVAAPPAVNIDYTGVVAHSGGTTAGGAFTGSITVSNGGTSSGTQDVDWFVYASLGNTTIDAGDKLVGTGTIAGGLGAGGSSGVLPLGNTWPAAAGTYYLVADIQAADDVNTADNRPASSGVAVAGGPAPDYAGTVSTGTPTRAGGAFTASLTVNNTAAVAGSSTVYWSVYASLDTNIDAGDKLVGSGSFGALPASGTSGPLAIASSWPAATGSYYLVARIQADDDIDLTDNTPASAAVNVGATDYSGTVVNTGGTTAGSTLTGTLTISNISGALALAGAQDVYWNVYASLSNMTIDAGDKLVGSGMIGGLPVGGSSGALAIASTWPATAGTYYLLADIYAGDDAVTANNKPASANIPVGSVDYTGSLNFSTGTIANRPFSGSIMVNNVGSRDGSSTVTWTVYASQGNTTIDAADKVVGSGTIAAGLAAGANSGLLSINDIWPALPGTYYLVAEVQAADDYTTGNNRFASGAVTVIAPNVDYLPLNVLYDATAPSTTTPGAAVKGTFQYRNQGTTDGIQAVYWTAYASRNTTLDASDTWIASGTSGALPAGTTSGTVGFSGEWPLDYGSYYLLVMVSEIEDVNSLNNTAASAATTSIGMYTGTAAENNHEPNGDYSLLVNVYNLGITLKPGMSIYVEGTMSGPPSPDDDDVLGFNTGTATTVTASMSWSGTQDMALYIEKGDPVPTFLKGISITNAESLAVTWTVDVAGAQRYLDIDNVSSKNVGAYTLIITAN